MTAQPAPPPASHLPAAAGALAAALLAVIAARLSPGQAIAVAVAAILGAGVWAAVHFGYARRRRPAMAAPYLIAIIAVAVASGLVAGNYQAWLRAQGLAGPQIAPTQKTAATATVATAKGKAAEPGAVVKLVDTYFADMRTLQAAFVAELNENGFLSAVSGQTLSTGGAINASPGKIAAGREAAARRRDAALARTDKLIADLKALPADTPEHQILIEDMVAEMTDVRTARADYWKTLATVADEMDGMAKVLIKAEGGWRADLDQRAVVFQAEADDQAYLAHKAQYDILWGQLDRTTAQLNRSADTLKTMAARWGGKETPAP